MKFVVRFSNCFFSVLTGMVILGELESKIFNISVQSKSYI